MTTRKSRRLEKEGREGNERERGIFGSRIDTPKLEQSMLYYSEERTNFSLVQFPRDIVVLPERERERDINSRSVNREVLSSNLRSSLSSREEDEDDEMFRLQGYVSSPPA